MTVHDAFRRCAHATACAIGSPYAFAAAVLVVIAWAVCGPAFHYSDTWQLVINTGTTIATFLVVFMIQNTQNRDARAIHLKLDELIRAVESARDVLVDAEDLPDEELARLAREFQRLRRSADARAAAAAPPPKVRRSAPRRAPSSTDKP